MTIEEFRTIYRTDKDLEEIIPFFTDTIVIREYDDGNSRDIRRKARKKEKQILHNIMYSALLAYRFRGGDIDGILDMAEFMCHMELPKVNAYDSVYIPLRKITQTGMYGRT